MIPFQGDRYNITTKQSKDLEELMRIPFIISIAYGVMAVACVHGFFQAAVELRILALNSARILAECSVIIFFGIAWIAVMKMLFRPSYQFLQKMYFAFVVLSLILGFRVIFLITDVFSKYQI